MNSHNYSLIKKMAAVLIALLLWQCLYMTINQRILLASPLEVADALVQMIGKAAFWKTILYSVLRITGGFLIAFATGVLLGIGAGRFKILAILLWPYATAIKAVPVASFIILALIWIGSDKLSILISALMVFPIIYTNVLEGVRSADEKLLEMAYIYRLSNIKKLIYIYLPALKTYILAAVSTALGIAFKAGTAAEVIGIPDGSIGERLYEAKIYFATAELLAWTAAIVIISIVLEKVFVWFVAKIYDGIESL